MDTKNSCKPQTIWKKPHLNLNSTKYNIGCLLGVDDTY